MEEVSTAIGVALFLGGMVAVAWAVQRAIGHCTALFILVSTGVVFVILFVALLLVILSAPRR